MRENAFHDLVELNYEEAKQYIGGVVFVSIMMTIGIIGNLHVLFVYTFRMKPSNHRIYIVVLAVLDFITCVIGMPFIIDDLRNPLTFTMVTACKVLRFITHFTCLSGTFILTVIAVDRYRKICIPLGKQISRKLAKFLCLLCQCLPLVLSWPAPILYGHTTVNTTNPNITGVKCSTDDNFKDTKYLAYFVTVLLITVIILSCVLVLLYILIGRQIRKHANFKRSKASDTSMDTRIPDRDDNYNGVSHSGYKEEDTMTSHSVKAKENSKILTSTTSLNSSSPNFCEDNETRKISSRNSKLRHLKYDVKAKTKSKVNRANKTTLMLFLLTVLFFISYFPYLILQIIAFVNKDYMSNLSFAGKVTYNTFVWCAFINNVANCFIYGFCDIRFRTEIQNIYKKLLQRKR